LALGEEVVDAAHGLDFQLRARREDNALQLETLAFAAGEYRFRLPVLVEELSSESITGGASLAKSTGNDGIVRRTPSC
jgi:hypothetical protein